MRLKRGVRAEEANTAVNCLVLARKVNWIPFEQQKAIPLKTIQLKYSVSKPVRSKPTEINQMQKHKSHIRMHWSVFT